jgi:HPt (histidine-containing phosphotransfer) domain-containing protein
MPAGPTSAVTEPLTSALLADDPDLREIVEEFVESLHSRIQEFETAYESRDWSTLVMLAHRLKGAGGSYGYPALSALAGLMEAAFKCGSAEPYGEWMRTLRELTARARAGLRSST